MLVLSRKTQQVILIGENIRITIIEVKGQSVRVGIEAPREVRVARAEVAHRAPAVPATSVVSTTAARASQARNTTVEVDRATFSALFDGEATPVAEPAVVRPATVWRDRRGLRGDSFVERRVERRASGALLARVANRRK